MRLIMKYQESDGCTYWCENVHGISAESPEAALIEFEEAFNKAVVDNHGDFTVFGKEFATYVFREYSEASRSYYTMLPDFYTLDEWFKDEGVEE